MEELFTFLSSSARLHKSNNRNNKKRQREEAAKKREEDDSDIESSASYSEDDAVELSRDRTGKRDTSEEKQKQVMSMISHEMTKVEKQ